MDLPGGERSGRQTHRDRGGAGVPVVNSAKEVFDVGMRSFLKFVELDEERKGTMGEKWGWRGAPGAPIHSHGAVICSNPVAVVGPMTCCRMMPCRSIMKVSGWPVTPKA